MRRRSRASSKPANAQSRKAKTLKAVRQRSSSPAGQETEVARLTRELSEAQEQQTATAEVLKIISTSPTELQPVLEVVARSAARFWEADDVTIFELDGQYLRITAAHWGAVPQDVGARFPCVRGHVSGRAVLDRKSVHVTDLHAEAEEFPEGSAFARRLGFRTTAAVPLLREGVAIGAIVLRRAEVNPFTNKQITLLETFAAQAVIAIENTRLLNELRQRTTDLTESLEQQTATSDVLQIISSSPGDLEPVFQAMLSNATRICEAPFGNLYLCEADAFRVVAAHHDSPAFVAARTRNPLLRPPPDAPLGRLAISKQVVQVADIRTLPSRDHPFVAAGVTAGYRTVLAIPLLKDDELIGAFTMIRQEVRVFTDKQIALLTNFARQAVIAIENARLLNELRQRTTDLTESLEQQTATSEVLQVISSSPGGLEPVFQVMLQNAARICEAKFGALYLYDGERFRVGALHNAPVAFAEFRRREPVFHPPPGTGLAKIVATKRTFHDLDITLDKGYVDRNPIVVAAVELGGFRTVLTVPLLKDDNLIGCISIYRQEVRPFTDKQTALVENFAAQAVIAIENTRLLNELRESLDQQTAAADVLKVISRSTFDLQTVLDTLIESAARLSDADIASINRQDGEAWRQVAQYRESTETSQFMAANPIASGRGSVVGRTLLAEKPTQIVDVLNDPEFKMTEVARLTGMNTLLGVPLMREGVPIGVMVMQRRALVPFTDRQIELLTTFADQAVIAIENTRLLNELRESLQQQTATADVLKVISRSTFDLQIVLNTLVVSAARLCEADTGIIRRREGDTYPVAATFGLTREQREHFASYSIKPDRTSVFGRAILERRTVHVPDVLADPEYDRPQLQSFVSVRTGLAVPLVREGTVVGVFTLQRKEQRPFSDKQVELVTTFADQAVIAIENVRLFDEVQTRTEELSELLQQQTATADVLKVISRSAFDLQTVLQTLVASAVRICDAEKGAITRQKGGVFYRAESYGFSPEFMDYVRGIPVEPERGTAAGRALLEGKAVHIADVRADPEYNFEAQRFDSYRTTVGVPMLREGVPIGVLALTRSEVRPFTDKQIELVQTFADQAAIAIENVRLFDEIQDKSRQLEEASQHKSQFLANMSHELRTPLNAILGYTELMADGAYGEPAEKMLGILKRLEANGKHLLGLINDVLDLSKIEAGQLVLELSDYCIQDIAQTVRSTLEPLAADKKLGFKVDVASQLPSGHGDGRRLTQVLINLVGNAIKFTDTGEIAIKAEAHNGSFHVSVRDTGPGISSTDQARLFQEFQQADNAITKKKGGTGLGLAISKRIIEMHGGRIWVESQPGQGSTFTFTLPVIVERQVEAA